MIVGIELVLLRIQSNKGKEGVYSLIKLMVKVNLRLSQKRNPSSTKIKIKSTEKLKDKIKKKSIETKEKPKIKHQEIKDTISWSRI